MESMSPNDIQSIIHVLRKNLPDEVYNLAGQSSVSLSFEQPAETMESIFNSTLNWQDHVIRNQPSLKRPSDIQISRGDPTKAKTRLGWQAKSSQEWVMSCG